MSSDMARCPSNGIRGENQNHAVLFDYGRVSTDSWTNKNSLVSFPQISVDRTQQSFSWNFSRCKSSLPSRCHFPDKSCRRFLDRIGQSLAKSLGPTMDREFPRARPVTATPCRGVRSVYKNLGAALKFNLGDRLSTQGGYYLPANF